MNSTLRKKKQIIEDMEGIMPKSYCWPGLFTWDKKHLYVYYLTNTTCYIYVTNKAL